MARPTFSTEPWPGRLSSRVSENGVTACGVIHDPINRETFVATRGKGATLDGAQLKLEDARKISEATVGVGYSSRMHDQGIVRLVASLVEEGAMFYRNASGALSLAYVAAGRLLRYAEEHMNAWDCLAGQLIVAEAGGCIELLNADAMTRDDGRIVVSTPAEFNRLLDLSKKAFGQTE